MKPFTLFLLLALSVLTSCVGTDPAQLLEQGKDKIKTGEHQGAMALFDQVLELDASNADAFYQRGLSKLALDNLSGAVTDFSRAANLGSTVPDLKGVASSLNKAAQAEINSSTAYYYKGTAKGRLKDLNGAIADLSKAIQLDATNDKAYGNRGLVYLQNNSRDAALSDFDKAITLNPQNANNFYNRAILHYKEGAGDTPKACADWKQAEALGFKDNNRYYERFCKE